MPVVSCRPRTPRPAFCLDSDLRAQPSADRGLARKLERAMESTGIVAVTAGAGYRSQAKNVSTFR